MIVVLTILGLLDSILLVQGLQSMPAHFQSRLTRQRSDTCRNLNNFFNFDKAENPPEQATEETKGEEFDDAAYDSDDPVEKIFGFFFGKREEKPMGMSRFGPDRFPEQYPATIDEWADPLESDNADPTMKLVRPLLKKTNLETRALKLTYSANRNGWNADAFHRAVDKKGGAIVVCKTSRGLVCGGYNPKGWVGYGEARGSIAAFLFRQNPDRSFTKLRKVGGPGLAQMDMPETGPSFGADSLVIPLEKDSPKVARSKLGSYYERFQDGSNSLFGKDGYTQLKDLKVYHGVYADGEYIPFTDAEPFALY